MIDIRKSDERGHANHGWLDSHFTFSFAEYFDPEHVQFRTLRVMNDDVVAGGGGFPKHPHRDMEIVTYVLEGALEHKDSMGTGSVIRPGDVQRMSAGTGVLHSEFNPSPQEPVHFLQIWIEPKSGGTAPNYEQLKFEAAEKLNRFKLLASPEKVAGAATINQDANVSVAALGMRNVQALRLLSPSADSTTGVTFGGAAVDAGGAWKARTSEPVKDGIVTVPRMSAVVLRADR